MEPKSEPTELADFEKIAQRLERTNGRGWKRMLAAHLGVPETNVHTWVAAGRCPNWVPRMLTRIVEIGRLKEQIAFYKDRLADSQYADHVISLADGFAVVRFKNGIGGVVAKGIQDKETAVRVASLPRLMDHIREAQSRVHHLLEDDDYAREAVDALDESEWSVPSSIGEWDEPTTEDFEKLITSLTNDDKSIVGPLTDIVEGKP